MGAAPWSPRGFEDLAKWYPATPWPGASPAFDRTAQFLARWDCMERSNDVAASTAIVLTPGLFAEYLPSCFEHVRRAFADAGHRVLRCAVRSWRSVDDQAKFLEREISRWLQPGERFLWLTHSKGAIDALWCAQSNDVLAKRCVGLVAMQPAVGRSWVLQAWRDDPRSFGDRSMRLLLRTPLVRGGSEECTSNRDPRITAWLHSFMPVVPTVHVVTWSVRPTSWVDSFHARLNALRPGCAHDGQFYIPDQFLPGTPLVCLPRLDHAQPVLGGDGLDVARLWRTLAGLIHTR